MYSPFTLTVVGLLWLGGMARITRLITEDTITQPVRDWIEAKAALRVHDDDTRADLAPWPWRKTAQIVNCHWCASIYVALPGTSAYLSWATGMTPFVLEHDWIGFGWGPATWAVWLPGALASSWLIATAADWLDSPPPEKHHTVNIIRNDSATGTRTRVEL